MIKKGAESLNTALLVDCRPEKCKKFKPENFQIFHKCVQPMFYEKKFFNVKWVNIRIGFQVPKIHVEPKFGNKTNFNFSN